MTNDDESAQERAANPRVSVVSVEAPLGYLQAVLSVINKDERNSAPLTLTVGGALVTGFAVHPAVWFRQMAEQVAAGPDDNAPASEGGQWFRAFFESIADEQSDEAERALSSIDTIYLVDALVAEPMMSGPLLMDEPACWQVAVARVDAWTIGLPHKRRGRGERGTQTTADQTSRTRT